MCPRIQVAHKEKSGYRRGWKFEKRSVRPLHWQLESVLQEGHVAWQMLELFFLGLIFMGPLMGWMDTNLIFPSAAWSYYFRVCWRDARSQEGLSKHKLLFKACWQTQGIHASLLSRGNELPQRTYQVFCLPSVHLCGEVFMAPSLCLGNREFNSFFPAALTPPN